MIISLLTWNDNLSRNENLDFSFIQSWIKQTTSSKIKRNLNSLLEQLEIIRIGSMGVGTSSAHKTSHADTNLYFYFFFFLDFFSPFQLIYWNLYL